MLEELMVKVDKFFPGKPYKAWTWTILLNLD